MGSSGGAMLRSTDANWRWRRICEITSRRCWSAWTRTGSRTPGSTSTVASTGAGGRSRWLPSARWTSPCGTSKARRSTSRSINCSEARYETGSSPTPMPPDGRLPNCWNPWTPSGSVASQPSVRNQASPGWIRYTGCSAIATPTNLHPGERSRSSKSGTRRPICGMRRSCSPRSATMSGPS